MQQTKQKLWYIQYLIRNFIRFFNKNFLFYYFYSVIFILIKRNRNQSIFHI